MHELQIAKFRENVVGAILWLIIGQGRSDQMPFPLLVSHIHIYTYYEQKKSYQSVSCNYALLIGTNGPPIVLDLFDKLFPSLVGGYILFAFFHFFPVITGPF